MKIYYFHYFPEPPPSGSPVGLIAGATSAAVIVTGCVVFALIYFILRR